MACLRRSLFEVLSSWSFQFLSLQQAHQEQMQLHSDPSANRKMQSIENRIVPPVLNIMPMAPVVAKGMMVTTMGTMMAIRYEMVSRMEK